MSRIDRIRAWVAQWRGIPARTERVDRIAVEVDRRIDELARRLDALDDTAALGRLERAAELALTEDRLRHEDVAGWITTTDLRVQGLVELQRSAAHEQRVVAEAALAPARDALVASLIEEHAHAGSRTGGVSVLTISWNHAAWLREAAASAAAVLDELGDRAGVHLILDDASDDETAAVLDELAADPRVVVIRAATNLHPARARNVLLAACPTEHAVMLDADNRLLPDGVVSVAEVARRHRPTIAWGQVIASEEDGRTWDAFAYAPAVETLRNGLCFDTMCIVDVGAVLELGGYSTDPHLGGVVDDFELLLRTLRRGRLTTFVPVVLGRYRLAPLRHSALAADYGRATRRVERMYLYDDPDVQQFAVAAVHPVTGVLWAWPGAQRLLGAAPLTSPVARTERPTLRRVLVVAPGGVDNLGDDAITWETIDRLQASTPGLAVHVVTDRDPPPQRPRRDVVPLRWDGTVLELWRGLSPDLLADAERRLGLAEGSLAPDVPGPLVRSIDDVDVVVVAGGGNLADDFADDVALPRLAVAAAAGARGIPVVWSAQGVGPLRDDRLEVVRSVLGDAAAVSVRDRVSADLLGCDVTVVSDAAVDVVPADPAVCTAELRRAGHRGGPYVVVHLRDAPYLSEGGGDVGPLVAAVDRLARAQGAAVVALCVNGNGRGERAVVLEQRSSSRLESDWLLLDATGDAELAAGLVSAAEWVVAHSFHVALWSLRAGTPSVLVAGSEYYRRKAEGLTSSFDLPTPVGVPPDISEVDLADRLRAVEADLSSATGATGATPGLRWLAERVEQLESD